MARGPPWSSGPAAPFILGVRPTSPDAVNDGAVRVSGGVRDDHDRGARARSSLRRSCCRQDAKLFACGNPAPGPHGDERVAGLIRRAVKSFVPREFDVGFANELDS